MRVLQVGSTLAATHGGPVTTMRALSSALETLGHSVTTAVTTLDDTDPDRADPVAQRFRGFGGSNAAFSPAMIAGLPRLIASADAVIVHQLHTFPAIAAARAARRRDVPWVIVPHASLMTSLREHGRARKQAFERLGLPHGLSAASAVVAMSEREARESRLVASVIGSARVEVVTPGAEHAGTYRPHARSQSKTFVYLGRIAREKNIDGLLDAWQHASLDRRGAELVLAGPYFGPDADRLRARVAEARSRGVRAVGEVGEQARAELLRNAAAVAHPSLSESFGFSVAEAIWHGCPVVAMPGIPAAELVRDTEAASVAESSTVQGFAVALEQTLTGRPAHPDTIHDIARHTFSWHAAAQRVLDLLTPEAVTG